MGNVRSVLVTGGGGFIGSRMVAHLVGAGFRVGVLGRSTGAALPEGVAFYARDITKPLSDFPEAYDAVVHLAGANDVDSRDPREALLATALGTRNILELSKRSEVKRVVYFSTFQVYGRSHGNISEATPVAPVNDYGITHFFAEEYVRMFGRTVGIETVRVRPSNVFGCPPSIDHDRWSLVPNCFCLEASINERVILLSSGRQYRDFISLYDVAVFTENLLKADRVPAVVNLVSGTCFSIHEVALIVKDAYVRLHGVPCKVDVRSNEPREALPLNVDMAIGAPFHASRVDIRRQMVAEIEATLKMLKENDK